MLTDTKQFAAGLEPNDAYLLVTYDGQDPQAPNYVPTSEITRVVHVNNHPVRSSRATIRNALTGESITEVQEPMTQQVFNIRPNRYFIPDDAYATAKGAKATFTFTGRDVTWVALKGPDRGKAEVWVDNVKVNTVDLYSATANPSQVVFTRGWTSSGPHTLEVRVLGTKTAKSKGTRVNVDAFAVLR